MTILAAFSASSRGNAPLNLAAQISRSTGEKVVASAVVERPWPPRGDPVEDEYLRYVTRQATESLERAVDGLPKDVEILASFVAGKRVELEKDAARAAAKDRDAFKINVARSTPSDEPFVMALLFRAPMIFVILLAVAVTAVARALGAA